MCKVISVVNQKGGVGKTTTTVNVGIGLAREGKKVLLIDADPQGSLTASLGYEEPDDLRITLATIMMDVINEEEISLEDGILHHQENVDLLPANIELSALEVTMGNVMSREMIMKEYIDAIRCRYDYILIDCMPSLGMMTINALVSSDSVLIPVQAAYLPVKGLQQLIKTKLLEGGIKKLKSALISVITTAGFDLKSPCYKLYEYCCNLLKGVFENDSQFVYIAQMDEHDDRYVPENWIKANPILEFDRDALENLIPIAHTARDMGGEDLRDFLVKQLNMWMQWSNSLYIKDIAKWKACAVLKSLKDFRGSKCYVGVDLSSGGDLTSIAIVIPFMVDGVKKYFVHTHSFIPSSRVDEHIKTDKVPYDVWIEKGLVTVTETLGGIKTDYKYIIKYLEDLVKEYDLKPQLICYDPHNASAFLSDLEALGFDSISVTQTAKELNDATVDFRLEILAGNVEIEGIEVGKEGNKIVVPADGLLVWSIANAKTISNNYGEIKIDKDITTERIDPIDAIIDAWKHAMKEEYRPDVNETVNEWLEQFEKYMKKGGEK